MTITHNIAIDRLSNCEDMMFGQRVAYVIETKGISKAWVAEKLGISKQALNYLLKHSIKPKFIDEFAELLELDPDWLETGIGNPVIRMQSNKTRNTTTLLIRIKSDILKPAHAIRHAQESIDFSSDNLADYIAYKLEDDSNFPPFIEGSILIFNMPKQPTSGDHVLVIIDKDGTQVHIG